MLRLIVPVAAVSVLLSSAAASGAETQTARDLVGTWTLVSTVSQQGGTKTDTFGPDPSGTLVFGSDGHYALIFLRRDLPKVASNSRTSTTPDESRAIAQGSIAHFGTSRWTRRARSWSSGSRAAPSRTGTAPSSGGRSRFPGTS